MYFCYSVIVLLFFGLVSVCTLCVFLCELACLVSHTSHLMGPLNTANRKPEDWDKELAYKTEKKRKTHRCFSVKPL